MDTQIKLKTFSAPYGTGQPQELTSKTVFADVDFASVTMQANMLSIGQAVTHEVTMFRYDFDNQTHAEYDGQLYIIKSIGKTKYPDRIKLLLSRG